MNFTLSSVLDNVRLQERQEQIENSILFLQVILWFKRSQIDAKHFTNFHVAPIASPDISNSVADSESEFPSCSELKSKTDKEVVLLLSGMQVFYLIRKEDEYWIEFSWFLTDAFVIFFLRRRRYWKQEQIYISNGFGRSTVK